MRQRQFLVQRSLRRTIIQFFAVVFFSYPLTVCADGAGLLTFPAYGPFNGNLNQLNVIEIINHHQGNPAHLRVTLIDNDSNEIGDQEINIPAAGVFHVIANEFRDGNGQGIVDRYGLVKIEAVSGSPVVSAQTIFYKMSSTQTPEYGFAIPFEDPQIGRSYGMYNSINPGVGGAVLNYISIANPGTQRFLGNLQLYRQDGTPGTRFPIDIDPSGRMDFPAGFPSTVTGTFEIIPNNLNQPYLSFAARYSTDNGINFNFGFALANHDGSCNETLPASTMGYGTNNWVEIGNLATVAKIVTVEVRNQGGTLVHSQQLNVPPRAQANFYVNPHIGEQNLGSVKVLCTAGEPILVQSAFYSRSGPASTTVTSAYVSQARGRSTATTDDRLAVAVNTNLGDFNAANWLKVSNEGSTPASVNISIRNSAGTLLHSSVQSIAARGTLDFDVHSRAGDNVAGSLMLSSSTSGVELRAEILRVFLDGSNQIAKIIPIQSVHIPSTVNIDPVQAQFLGDRYSLAPYRANLTLLEAQHMLNHAALGDGQALSGLGTNPNRAVLVDALLAIPNPADLESQALNALDFSLYRPSPDRNIWTIYSAQVYALHNLRYMNPVQARMGLFWLNHFATNLSAHSYDYATYRWMKAHIDLLFRNALGSFEDLSIGYTRDQAGAYWLSNTENTVYSPNENYGREFLELFNLGADHLVTNQPNYTEDDVVRGATRALSGYGMFDSNGVRFVGWSPFAWMENPSQPSNIPMFQGRSFAASRPFISSPSQDTLTEYVLYNHPASAEYIAGKIFMALVHVEPNAALLTELGDRFRNSGFNIRELTRLILNSSAMYSPESRGARIEGPQEKYMRMMRTWNIPILRIREDRGTPGNPSINTVDMYSHVNDAMAQAGAPLLQPPTVFGWADADYVKRAGAVAKGGSWVLAQQAFGKDRYLNALIERIDYFYTFRNLAPNNNWQAYMPSIPAGTNPAAIPDMLLTHFERKFGVELSAERRQKVLYYLQTVLDNAPPDGQPLPAQGSPQYRTIVWNPNDHTSNNSWERITEQKVTGLLYLFMSLPENNL